MNPFKNMFKYIKLRFEWKFKWIKILFTPFVLPQVKFYAGKTRVGVPYFYPRKWVKLTHKDKHKAALKDLAKFKKYIEENPDSKVPVKTYEQLYDSFKNYTKPVDLKIGFSSCGLGYKTKWSNTDYRYEYGPVYSFVFFGYQIAIMIGHDHPDQYWCAWLYYEKHTDKRLSKEERIKDCIKNFPLIYTVWNKAGERSVNYYYEVLKPEYRKFIKDGK